MDKEKSLIKKFKILTKQEKPKPKIVKNCIWAFVVGGMICDIGQLIMNFLSKYDFTKDQIGAITSISLIFLGALLTGIGIYDKIAEKGGAGTVVPITGFSNAIVSASIEFKKEGFVFGVAAKMFTIAGPVLVYGIGSSVIIGIIYYFFFL
ncbi:stage V sporulation protein AC [Clostridium sp. HCP1S3_B4]|uniref:stage V sporulation protein AC n=1 Tax=unclassified Clostridium TaxID=2614128 RepID=UPI003F89144A